MVTNTAQRRQFLKLQRLGVRHFEEIIHDQPREWLRENFKSGSRKFPVNVTVLIRNIIWQTRQRIINKEREPMTELIRTFWYSHIKPTLARAGALSNESDQYDEVIQQLVIMVRDEKLMSYSDIGFSDENQNNRAVGVNANVILFAEKAGHADFLKRIARKYGVTTIALGGQPSALSVEYLVDDLREAGVDVRRSFFLFSIVDYDSSGWIIRDAFIRNLRAFGVKNIKNVDLINPDMLTKEEILFSRFSIRDKKRTRKKNTDWLKQVRKRKYANQKFLVSTTKSSKRKIYGLESESISSKRLSEKLDELIPPLIGKSERLLSIVQLDRLINSMEQLILGKLRRR